MMLKVKELRAITGNEPKQVQDEVNRLLSSTREQWGLHGDFKVVWGQSQFTYCQAVVRLEPMEVPSIGQVMPGAPILVPRG